MQNKIKWDIYLLVGDTKNTYKMSWDGGGGNNRWEVHIYGMVMHSHLSKLFKKNKKGKTTFLTTNVGIYMEI